jgi:hypothetical protein
MCVKVVGITKVMWNNKQDWDEYRETYRLFYCRVPAHCYFLMSIFPHFKFHDNPNSQMHYEKYVNQYDYTGSYEEYKTSAKLIYQTVNNIDTSFMFINNDPLFRKKEFGQLLTLVKDVYLNGNKNIPTLRPKLDPNNIVAPACFVHPGNHLCWALMFLHPQVDCFISCNNEAAVRMVEMNAHIYEEITEDKQIYRILNTQDITAWFERFDGDMVPHIYPAVDTSTGTSWTGDQEQVNWKSFQNGDCNWPWDTVSHYNYHGAELFDWDDIEIKDKWSWNNDYRLMSNNAFAFSLTDLTEDQNFRRVKNKK